MQGDYTSVQVQASFVDATGTQINISGKTIYFQCYKNGQSITLDTPAISGDGYSAIAAILPSACATSGELYGEFQIVDADGGKKVPPFKIMVLSSPDSAVQTTDFKVLTEKLGAVSTAVTNANTAVNDANAAVTNINNTEQSITTAESSRVTAEDGRVTAENGRVTAEQSRVAAEDSRVTAESNRATAETQRQTDTTTAITNAETATNNANHVPQYGDNGNWKSWNGTAYADSGKPWKGEKGDTGPSFEYGESYDTLAALQAAYPSGDTKGHLVGTTPYVWDGTTWKESIPDLSGYLKSADAANTYVTQTRAINSKPLNSDITLTAADVSAAPSSHTDETVSTENGVHGLRWYDSRLQAKSGDNWDDISALPRASAKYGVIWHYTQSSPALERTDDSATFTATATNGSTAGHSDFDDKPIYKDLKICNVVNREVVAYEGEAGFKRDGSNGDVMLEIPKFYYKVTDDGTNRTVMVKHFCNATV